MLPGVFVESAMTDTFDDWKTEKLGELIVLARLQVREARAAFERSEMTIDQPNEAQAATVVKYEGRFVGIYA